MGLNGSGTDQTTREGLHGAYRFDPVRVGRLETAAWVAYYRREWRPFLRSAIGVVDAAFGMRQDRTLYGAWLTLRANQVWAPVPDNDPDAAREYMRRFYDLLVTAGRSSVDPVRASELEVDWWRVHRAHQRDSTASTDELADTLNALYVFVYRTEPEVTRRAAELRVAAMDLSDEWVAAGCDLASPILTAERRLLVASYTALRTAIDMTSL